jgi:CRISPR/Cas system CSM-associated protein Csm3 (group 7 of RAMP superfamily)
MPEEKRRLHRRIIERFVITGALRLETPAHFGSGDTDAFTDMPLLKDELDGSPLLPGTSIAGALRNYLRERQLGDYASAPMPPPDDAGEAQREKYLDQQGRSATILFGAYRGDDRGNQSPLIVHDASGRQTGYELRDGVRIEPETRTAEDEKKYDITLLAAGTTFNLRFDLAVGLPDECESLADETGREAFATYREKLLKALVTALAGLTRGEITLGARKRRGFGRCRVDEWTVKRYDLRTRAGLLAWLAEDHPDWGAMVASTSKPSIVEALNEAVEPIEDERKRFAIDATFALDGSLMVRSGAADSGPDMVHLHSPRPKRAGEMSPRPILAGTSWAGALRSRAEQISYTLAPENKGAREEDKVAHLLDEVFGPAEIKSKKHKPQTKAAQSLEEVSPVAKEPRASRLEIAETEIGDHGISKLEQTRIKIDRFTGGAYESALFSEQPLFGGKHSRLKLKLSLRLPAGQSRNTQYAEIGLLLLLLKDLWTGDLTLGGEVGIGRGRLQGVAASLDYDGRKWELAEANGNLNVTQGDRAELQRFVEMLKEELRYA